MSSNNIQRRREKRRTTFVLIPADESGKTRTFSAGGLGIIGIVLSIVLVVVVSTVVMMVSTPIRDYLPVSNPELENRYGKRIVEIQNQLRELSDELVVLREYNLRLRRVLGENVTSPESSFIAKREQAESQTSARIRNDASPVWTQQDVPVVGEVARGSNQPVSKATDVFPLSFPTRGYFTREYNEEQGHLGIDIAGKEETPVVAAASGTVVFADWTYDFGYMVIIAHGEGYMTVYKHNSTLFKNVGATVRRGEIIALLGNTGRTSTGPHVHFEVWRNGIALDPTSYLLTSQQ